MVPAGGSGEGGRESRELTKAFTFDSINICRSGSSTHGYPLSIRGKIKRTNVTSSTSLVIGVILPKTLWKNMLWSKARLSASRQRRLTGESIDQQRLVCPVQDNIDGVHNGCSLHLASYATAASLRSAQRQSTGKPFPADT
jgi:hypothetical protein